MKDLNWHAQQKKAEAADENDSTGGGYRMEKEFDVEIKEVLSRVQRVKAESLDDAINKAMDMYYSEGIVLSAEDMKGDDFTPISEEQLPSSLPEENKKEIGGKAR